MLLLDCDIVKSIAYPNNKSDAVKMPENITNWLISLESSPRLIGIMMGVFMSTLQILIDNKRYTIVRHLLEVLTVVGLSYMATNFIFINELDPRWSAIACGMIGTFGSKITKNIGMMILRSKIPAPKDRRKRDGEVKNEED